MVDFQVKLNLERERKFEKFGVNLILEVKIMDLARRGGEVFVERWEILEKFRGDNLENRVIFLNGFVVSKAISNSVSALTEL